MASYFKQSKDFRSAECNLRVGRHWLVALRSKIAT